MKSCGYFSTVQGNYLLDRMINVGQHILIEVRVAIQASKILHELVDRHRYIQAFRVVVVLIHVQHDNGVR